LGCSSQGAAAERGPADRLGVVPLTEAATA
jgi:hypothetical protein